MHIFLQVYFKHYFSIYFTQPYHFTRVYSDSLPSLQAHRTKKPIVLKIKQQFMTFVQKSSLGHVSAHIGIGQRIGRWSGWGCNRLSNNRIWIPGPFLSWQASFKNRKNSICGRIGGTNLTKDAIHTTSSQK